jgi:hypothetical protein
MGRDEVEEDLEATSADIADDAEELTAIEHEKETLAPTEPATVDALASDAERLAQQILRKTRMEKQLADDLQRRKSSQR